MRLDSRHISLEELSSMSDATSLPDRFMKRVLREMAAIPKMQGKLILTFEISCGTGGTINTFKVKRFTEDEER